MASQRQIAANRRNGAKSRGPLGQQGKARSRMNALRHGLAAKTSATSECTASTDAAVMDAAYQRLRQIELERVKAFNDVHYRSRSEDFDGLLMAVWRLAALDRYSQRSHSKLKKETMSEWRKRRVVTRSANYYCINDARALTLDMEFGSNGAYSPRTNESGCSTCIINRLIGKANRSQ